MIVCLLILVHGYTFEITMYIDLQGFITNVLHNKKSSEPQIIIKSCSKKLFKKSKKVDHCF